MHLLVKRNFDAAYFRATNTESTVNEFQKTTCNLYRMTYTRCCIDTINSTDDEHWVARNV